MTAPIVVDVEVQCGECAAPMELRTSKFGPFWGCTRFPTCRGTHGAHPDGAPLGTPADKATKAARIAAHDAFDRIWKARRMPRKAAYRWMQQRLGMTKDEAHIGRFTKDQCIALIVAVEKRFPEVSIRRAPLPSEQTAP